MPPDADPFDLARRLGRIGPNADGLEAATLGETPAVGDQLTFQLINLVDKTVYPVTARVRLVSPNAYVLVDSRVGVSDSVLEEAARAWEEAYSFVTANFGPAPGPGIDGDPRIFLLHVRDIALASGYVNGDDTLPRAVASMSNERDAIYLDASLLGIGPDYAGLLAHEFQHLVHHAADPTEENWVDEGLAQVAREQVSGDTSAVRLFLRDPDLQLNSWVVVEDSAPHYGKGQLFFRYLLQRVGGVQHARALVAEQADGIATIRNFLRDLGRRETFEEIFADWVVANLVDDPQGGPFAHEGIEVSVLGLKRPAVPGRGGGTVAQFGADYIELTPPAEGALRFAFDGDETVPVIAAEPASGGGFWWANRGDEIDTALTREVDLTGVASATLTFKTWFSIEEGWDYGYVEVSVDGGRTWQILRGRHSRDDLLPAGLPYGPGYSGNSGGVLEPRWVEEEIDLSPFAGRAVLLRFEYVTDSGTHLPGWALDDIAVPEVGFLDDAEGQDPGWESEGFARMTGPLPQRFILRLVEFLASGGYRVTTVKLDGGNRAEIEVSARGGQVERAVLVIAGATENTGEPARYRWDVSELPKP